MNRRKEKAKQEIRSKAAKADLPRDALVILLLLSESGVVKKYLFRIKGLNYKWSGETLLPGITLLNLFVSQSKKL